MSFPEGHGIYQMHSRSQGRRIWVQESGVAFSTAQLSSAFITTISSCSSPTFVERYSKHLHAYLI